MFLYLLTYRNRKLFSVITWTKMAAKMKKVKFKAISGLLNDDFGFKLSDDGSVLSVENVYCMTCN